MQDIIVYGRRLDGSFIFLNRGTSVMSRARFDPDGELRIEPNVTPTQSELSGRQVELEGILPENLANALQAAENIRQAALEFDALAAAKDPAIEIVVLGSRSRLGNIRSAGASARLIVIQRRPTNGGVGEASLDANGNPVFRFWYPVFDGDLSDGMPDYANPVYQNRSGLIAVFLHELGHVSPGGVTHNANSFNAFSASKRAPIYSLEAYDSQNRFWNNNEAYANAFAKLTAAALNFSLWQWEIHAIGGFSPQSPATILNQWKMDFE